MIKTLVLSILVCLLLQLSSASATNYVLPANIDSGPFASCSGSGPTYTCTSEVRIGKNHSIVLTSDVTLNVSGEFKVADNTSVDKGVHIFNVNATTLHIDGSASMVFTNLTASGNVTIHKNANLTANVTTIGGSLYIDDNSTVNGTCSPSDSQCTPLPSMVNPTVFSQTTTDTTPIIYGTYSSSVATSLTVMVNSVTYALSNSSELTNSSDNWTLDLSSITPLPLDTYNVVATSADADGDLSDTSNNELVIEEAQWWDTNWTKCRDITIANTGTTTLSNFPAYIDLAYDSDMQSNYYDIRFINTSCANSGSELDFEIETYTAASADVWVEIDSLPAAGKTIAVYYGNASATTGENASGTWVSSHKGVWHLSESTNATNLDSTSNSNNGTPQNSPVSTSGKIGKALDFDVGDKTHINLGTHDSLDLSTVNWTIALWVKPFSDFGDRSYPLMYQYGSYGASVGLDKDNGKIEHWRNDDNALYNNTNLNINAWNHVVVTRNSFTTTLYLNGNANGAAPSETINKTNFGSHIGGYPDWSGGDLKGLIDEVRVSNVVRSPDWIKQSYDLVQDQGGHVSIGDEVEAATRVPVLEYRFDELSWDGSSGEVDDNSTSNFDGRRIGDTTTITEGQVCRAGTFDGTGDYINADGIDSTLNSTASLSFWIKTTQSGNNAAWAAPGILGIEQRRGSNDIFWGYLDASGHMRIQKGSSSSAQSSTAVNDDVWHHIVLTWDSTSGNTQVFVDGNLESSVRSSAGDVSNTFSSIGRIEGSFSRENFNGQLDELLVFNLLLSASDVSAIYTNQLNGDNYDGSARVCPVSTVDHFEILHDTRGFTCEAEAMIIKACADASCDTLFDQETSITLSPSGFEGGDTLVFTGQTSTNLRVTDEGTVTLAKVSASPDANLTCFNASTETCEITFANDGFEIYGANIGDTLADQLAANNFSNVNLRAVRSNENVCEALLEGIQEINLTYNCDSPNQCLTQLNGIAISGDGTGDNTGSIEVEFNNLGVASLAVLNYPDAGRLTLSVQADVEGVTITHSDIETVDVYPSYLALSVAQTELIYGAVGEQNNYVAGEDFTFVIGAYGTNDNLLPNYQAETPQLKVTKVAPSGTGENGNFKYSGAGTRTSTGLFSNTPDISSSTADDHFVAGEYSFNQAYYNEVGRIQVDFKDLNYLGNEIVSNGILTLGDFYPAYFNVVLTDTPTLADTCSNTFSYLGQTIQFETSPKFTLTAYNALDTITSNYSDTYWNYLPNEATLEANLSYLDSSTYAKEKSASVIDLGDEPVVANNDNYDGSGTITIHNGHFRYNKVNPDDNSAFSPVSPFEAQLTLAFASNFFSNTFADQNGIEDTVCYQSSHSDNTCLGWDIDEVNGTQMRYGRLTLESTYGPETEPLNVPIKAEYFEDNQWLINTDDNCTNIDFTQSGGEIELTDNSLASLVGSVTSEGTIMLGLSVGNQFELNPPGTAGELNIWLDPTDLDVTWPTYLNYDWNGNGFINTDDFPKATVSFGLFRGNDRIIHWREVFN
ncbi:DUF2341 domain-containing protein [uncultured Paraglaciecola sp.]|uniref:DUF2341 domain-containing protein n=1 Tax=uncultured Paraglaciecola sp. TaxID=1765024 RepID=UPI0025DF42D3|nr:DUF2341 domain-containing protein [uncultured Paraglaciecola sp.]